MKLAEVLTGPDVWCKGKHREGVKYCLQGAVLMLERNHEDPGHTLTRLIRVLGTEGIANWNDEPERTWEEVAAVVEAYDRDRMLNP
jgi:hypothetical protein